MQLIACAERKPLGHRLNALAVAKTDQSRHVERAHLSPCFVTQPIQKRLEPTSKLASPVRYPANHGRPLQKSRSPMSHRKSDLGIPRPRKICQSSARRNGPLRVADPIASSTCSRSINASASLQP